MAKHAPVKPRSRIEVDLFEERPITLDGFVLRARLAEAVGRPTLEQWAAAFDFATASEESSPFWVGDLWNYAEGRPEWRKGMPQTLADLGRPLALETIYTYGSVATKVTGKARELSKTMRHARAVQSLRPAEQVALLEKSNTEGWNARELGLEVRAKKRRGTIEGQANLEGMFRVWQIDCPWKYKQAQPSKVSAQSHYPGMTVDELIAMGPKIQAHTMRDAVAFFWVTAPFLYYATEPEKGPDPYRVILAWGFEPKTGGVWDKVKHNYGNYLSIRHEHLIIATRGSCTPDRPVPMPDSVFTEQASDEHSEKPDHVYQMIEKLYDGPRAEMFGRRRREGWTVYGNQIANEVAA